jgi:hypothetical protein
VPAGGIYALEDGRDRSGLPERKVDVMKVHELLDLPESVDALDRVSAPLQRGTVTAIGCIGWSSQEPRRNPAVGP